MIRLVLLLVVLFPSVSLSDDMDSEIKSIFPELKAEQLSRNSEHAKLVDAVIEQLRSGDSEKVLKAEIALQELANEADVEILIRLLKVPKPNHIQIAILRTLGNIGDPRAGKAIRFEIEQGELPVQLAGIDALGRLEHSWVVPVLTRYLMTSDSFAIRQRSASSLGKIGSSQAIYSLRQARAKSRGPLQRSIDWALTYANGGVDFDRVDREIPAGKKTRRVFKGMPYNIYVPTLGPRTKLPPRILVCVHGLSQDYNGLFELCARAGKHYRVAVIAPYFDNITFPEYGKLNLNGTRADTFLIDLIKHVSEITQTTEREVFMFGHGDGGNFVQRFVLAHPERIARAAAHVTEFTVLDENIFFPEGLRANPLAPEIKPVPFNYLKTDFALLVEKKSEAAWSGRRFYESVIQYVGELGIYPRLANPKEGVYRTYDKSWEAASAFIFKPN